MLTLVLLSLATCCHGYTVQQPVISLVEPQGIRFAYPDDGQIHLVTYHYNVNKPLVGVNAAEYHDDDNSPSNGYFIIQNTNLKLEPGDIVTYWINVITSFGGYILTDQSWIVSDSGSGNSGTVIPSSCSAYPCDESSCDMSTPPCNGLIFEENWDDFDLERWQHEITMSGGGNWEFQIYTNNRSNSYVRDNTLFIKPTLTADHYGESFLSSGTVDLWGGSPADVCTGNSFYGCMRTGSSSNYLNPTKSARIRTVNSFAFKYGRVEIEAKMPTGDWLWPAIWFLPKDQRYGSWPASGEIDLLESRGNADLKDDQGVSHGNDAMGSTLHWGPYWPMNAYEKTTHEAHGNLAAEFHKYGLVWNEDGITCYLDDVEVLKVDPGDDGFWGFGEFDKDAPGSDNPWVYGTSKMTPFDQEFYLVMNVAVGGTNGYFPDQWINGNGAKPWSNDSPTAMKDFWEGKDSWYPTWQPDVNNGENAALQVKTIRVWVK